MLVIIVIICNLIIVILNLWIIWKLSQVKSFLSKTADIFINLEANFNLILNESSLLILQTALEINTFNNKYRLLKKRNQQIKQVLLFLRLGYRIYSQNFN